MMGTQGVDFTASKTSIITTIKAHKGRIIHAAKSLNVCPATLRKRINEDQELIDLLSEIRNEYKTFLLDISEDTLVYAIENKEKEIGQAIKSAFFLLNNHGKERGYAAKNFYGEDAPSAVDKTREEILIEQEVSKRVDIALQQRGVVLPKVSTQQSILYQEPAGEEVEVPPELGAEGTL